MAGYYRTRERFGAALFGAAITKAASMKFYGKTFDAKCADGKGLFDTAHPSKMGKATQCNQFSDASVWTPSPLWRRRCRASWETTGKFWTLPRTPS